MKKRKELQKKSFEDGFEDGEKSGFENGVETGEKQKSIEIARNMLDLRIDIDKISKATGLSKEEIKGLK